MSLFHTPFPVRVMLRNKTLALVEQPVATSCGFPLLGRFAEDGAQPQLWRTDGRWLETGAKHDFDIVGEVVGKDAKSQALTYVPYAPAAGAKGPQ